MLRTFLHALGVEPPPLPATIGQGAPPEPAGSGSHPDSRHIHDARETDGRIGELWPDEAADFSMSDGDGWDDGDE